MANVKTAISIKETLFKEAETTAREMSISRNRLFTLALEEFLQRHRNRKLLERLNEAHEDDPALEEGTLLRAMRQKHRKVVGSKSNGL